MRHHVCTAAVLIILAGRGDAQGQFDVSPDAIGSVSVSVSDNARSGCWTNLREARVYAEDKLSMAGYQVVPENGRYRFEIDVCAGVISTALYRFTLVDGMVGTFVVAEKEFFGNSASDGNFNGAAIDVIQQLIGDF